MVRVSSSLTNELKLLFFMFNKKALTLCKKYCNLCQIAQFKEISHMCGNMQTVFKNVVDLSLFAIRDSVINSLDFKTFDSHRQISEIDKIFYIFIAK